MTLAPARESGRRCETCAKTWQHWLVSSGRWASPSWGHPLHRRRRAADDVLDLGRLVRAELPGAGPGGQEPADARAEVAHLLHAPLRRRRRDDRNIRARRRLREAVGVRAAVRRLAADGVRLVPAPADGLADVRQTVRGPRVAHVHTSLGVHAELCRVALVAL